VSIYLSAVAAFFLLTNKFFWAIAGRVETHICCRRTAQHAKITAFSVALARAVKNFVLVQKVKLALPHV
jgi:hypothetical protein